MRLFLALEPPDSLRERLGELADLAQARCGGRRMPDESLHLTLAFLGEVPEERVTALSAWVGERSIPSGEWRLDAWGTFRRPGIVWVGGREPDTALARLHGSLWDGLAAFGFNHRLEHFVPHVTLLRRARRLETRGLPTIDLAWPWRRFSLVRSFTENDGARYQTLARSPVA
ncbi:RNA 2',3'-cyclic phosphodiesterase [Halomonas sp. ATCH28]|uniref:RNA 2',3'-cyclic phosphodiesterase n=1 Tax=Halomonas gemina TaxID=2945105 RepID=A0ABT0T3R2_9GAMM|nr:RNA 2',3'-cyclic phosphodiesterase [Halomonas gemina]MCL7941499.1 RNA 2',3'-cyclic phosphodiesterase [Halomonas gemina]